MVSENKNLPAPNDVKRIVAQTLNEDVLTIKRFPTGNCHFVFDVKTRSARNIVVRLARPENLNLVKGAIYWHNLLKPKGIPLPEILVSDLAAEFPFIILQRFPGEDLNFIYPQLSKPEKKNLAVKLAKVQNIVGSLPQAKGFGFLDAYETANYFQTWTDVLQNSLERSRRRIQSPGIFEVESVTRVEEKLHKFEDYLSNIEPKGFLDDITTKNVIVHNGKLSGIVDVDCVCFGDNLLTIALTRMSLLLSNYELDYIDFWCEAIQLSPEQRKILDFYTALFCVDFMSEFGHAFNKETPLPVDNTRFKRLNLILKNLLAAI